MHVLDVEDQGGEEDEHRQLCEDLDEHGKVVPQQDAGTRQPGRHESGKGPGLSFFDNDPGSTDQVRRWRTAASCSGTCVRSRRRCAAVP